MLIEAIKGKPDALLRLNVLVSDGYRQYPYG